MRYINWTKAHLMFLIVFLCFYSQIEIIFAETEEPNKEILTEEAMQESIDTHKTLTVDSHPMIFFDSHKDFDNYLNANNPKDKDVNRSLPLSESYSTVSSASYTTGAGGVIYAPEEAFQANGFTGKAQLPFPIQLPPGRKIQPKLELKYNGTLRSSWCGKGWSLKLGSIQRSTLNGVPKYDTSDTFVYFSSGGGTGNLISTDSNNYRLAIEDSTRSKFFFDGISWVITDPNGNKYYFGSSDSSRETTSKGVFGWHLDKVIDLNGNYMKIVYEKIQGKPYIDYIEYTGNESTSSAPWVKIEFYKETISSPAIYRSGEASYSSQLLKEIRIYVNNSFSYKYVLSYDQSEHSKQYLLKQFKIITSDNQERILYDYKYTYDTYSLVKETVPSSSKYYFFYLHELEPERAPYRPTVFSKKKRNDKNYVYYPEYAGTEGLWLYIGEYNFGSLSGNFGGPNWHPLLGNFIDSVTKSRAIMNPNNGEWKIWSNWEHQVWITNFGVNCTPLTGDFNGDGLTDILAFNKSNGEWRVAISDGERFIAEPSSWKAGFGKDCSPFVGDFNRDGLTDIGIFDDSTGTWQISLCDSKQFLSPDTWIENFGIDKTPILGDFNGDSLIDIGYYDADNYHVRIATGTKDGFYENSQYDLDNIGSSSETEVPVILYSHPFQAVFDCMKTSPGSKVVEISKITPKSDNLEILGNDLLIETKNETNGISKFYYEQDSVLGGYYLKKIIKNNGLGDEYITESSVTGGVWTEDRKWAGHLKNIVTKYHERNGEAVGEKYEIRYSFLPDFYNQNRALIGKLKCVIENRFSPLGESVRTEKIYNWNTTQTSEGVNIVRLSYEDKYLNPDNGSDYRYMSESNPYPKTYDKHIRISYSYDSYGNVIETINSGDADVAGDEQKIQLDYSYNTTDWVISLPYSTKTLNGDNSVVSQAWFYYDNNSSYVDMPSKGHLTKQISYLDTVPNFEDYPAVTYAYDAYGNIIQTTDPKGLSSHNSYDNTTHAYIATSTNALGHIQQFTYDYSSGQALTATDANGQVSINEYDSFGRPIRIWCSLDTDGYASVINEYNYDIFPSKITKKVKADYASNSYIATYTFLDGFGKIIQVKSPAEPDPISGAQRQIVSGVAVYNYRGSVVEEYQPYFATPSDAYSVPDYNQAKVVYEYDKIGRVISITKQNESGNFIQATSSYSGWCTTAINFNGVQKESYSDAYGNLIKVTEYNNGNAYNANYEYDVAGNLIKTIDHLGNDTVMTYDSLGRKLAMDDPDMGDWKYRYDDNGNLILQTDAKGQAITFAYDSLNRLTQKNTPDGVVSYSYDQGENAIGRLSRVDYGSGSTEFFYDELGREIKVIKRIDGADYAIERAYDAMDRVKTLKYPDGETLTYIYDTSGAIKEIRGLNKAYAKDIDYNASGQMKSVTYGNGAAITYTYNDYTQRLSHLVTQTTQTTIQDLAYQFDNNGNILQINDAMNTASQSFQYDNLDRLTQVNNLSGYGTIDYAYNEIGNITQKGTKCFNYGESGAGPHALTTSTDGQISCAYDLNGNMITKNDTIYEYDTENRLKRVEKPSSDIHDTFNLSLKAGWNFITLPVIPDGYNITDEIPITTALSSLTFGVDYDQVTQYDASANTFKSYCNNSEYNQFNTMKYLQGYQVYCLRDTTLTITGSSPSASYSAQLPIGYNLIGVDITNNGKAASAAFFNISYSKIKRYNPDTQVLEDISSGDTVGMGRAYYVECTSSSSYSVSGLENITTFTYDGDGGRVKKYSSIEGTTYYVGQLFEKHSGINTRHIYLGNMKICSATNIGDYNYYHSDHLGSTSDITDKNGNLLQHTEYTPYGEIYEPASIGDVTDYLFTGKLLDTSTDLYYFGARYYDPELGRFTQADTLVVHPHDPQDFNRYAYCRNNPINLVDPSGHGWWSDFWDGVSDFFHDVGDFLEDAWEYIASAAIIVATAFAVIATGGTASPFMPMVIGEVIGGITGGISAYQAGGDVGQGIFAGTAIGGITAMAAMGFKGYMLNSVFADKFISPFQGGMITAGEFGIGGFGAGLIQGYAGGARSWSDAFKHAGISAAIGAGIGFAAGYSYTAGWQGFLHGADTQAHNRSVWQKLKDALSVCGKSVLDTASPGGIAPIQTVETAGAMAEAAPKIMNYTQNMYEEYGQIYGYGSENPYYDVLGVQTRDGKPYSERIRR